MAEKPTSKEAPAKAPAAKAASPKADVAKAAAPKAAPAASPRPAAASAPAAGHAPHTAEHKTHSFRRRLLGKVVSDKMDKTVVVEVVRRSRDAMYKKYVRSSDRYKAHDETNQFKVGDRVEIMEHRPISKDKRWKVVRLVARAVEE
jgi:small subunit ribosomal protein S17